MDGARELACSLYIAREAVAQQQVQDDPDRFVGDSPEGKTQVVEAG